MLNLVCARVCSTGDAIPTSNDKSWSFSCPDMFTTVRETFNLCESFGVETRLTGIRLGILRSGGILSHAEGACLTKKGIDVVGGILNWGFSIALCPKLEALVWRWLTVGCSSSRAALIRCRRFSSSVS